MLYTNISSAVDSVDEFIVFKKHFVTALNNDKETIEAFLDKYASLRRLADIVFRCRRVRFPQEVQKTEVDPRLSKYFISF